MVEVVVVGEVVGAGLGEEVDAELQPTNKVPASRNRPEVLTVMCRLL
ncbi:MAG: hypothetical protein RL011_652 [Pseudomonadota bacterium]